MEKNTMPRKKNPNAKPAKVYSSLEENHQATIDHVLSLITPEQAKTIRRYMQYCEDIGNRITTRKNYACVLHMLGRWLKDKPFEKAAKDDLVNYIRSLKDHAATSRNNWTICIRKFYKFVYGGEYLKKKHAYPPVVDDPVFESHGKAKAQHIKSKKDLVTKEEFMEIVRVSSVRDKCILMLLWEGGFRASELVSLNKNSIEFDDLGAKAWIEKSKTKERYVRLVDAVPHLKAWMNEHALKEPSAPLFYSLRVDFGARIHFKSVSQIIQRAAARAGIKRHVFAHMLRHVAVTNCKLMGLDADDIAKRHGITPMTIRNVYLHYDDSDVDAAYLKARGQESEEEKQKRQEEREKTMPKKCAKCGTLNAWDVHFCSKCGEPVDLKTALEKDKTNTEMMQLFIKALKAKNKAEMAEVLKDIPA